MLPWHLRHIVLLGLYKPHDRYCLLSSRHGQLDGGRGTQPTVSVIDLDFVPAPSRFGFVESKTEPTVAIAIHGFVVGHIEQEGLTIGQPLGGQPDLPHAEWVLLVIARSARQLHVLPSDRALVEAGRRSPEAACGTLRDRYFFAPQGGGQGQLNPVALERFHPFARRELRRRS